MVCQEIPIGPIFKIYQEFITFHYLYCYNFDHHLWPQIIRKASNSPASTSAPLPQVIHIRVARMSFLKHKSEPPILLLKTLQWLLKVKNKSFQWFTIRPSFSNPVFLSDLLYYYYYYSYYSPHSHSAPVTMKTPNSSLFLDMLSIFWPLHLLFPILPKISLANSLLLTYYTTYFFITCH